MFGVSSSILTKKAAARRVTSMLCHRHASFWRVAPPPTTCTRSRAIFGPVWTANAPTRFVDGTARMVATSSSSLSSDAAASSSSIASTATTRSNSTAAAHPDDDDEGGSSGRATSPFQPSGDLFGSARQLRRGAIGAALVGRTASVRRVFGPGANAQGLLTCGGEELARHASFDPDYETAKGYIRSRAIGPAVLSPILISGLVGALVEAALPQTVVLRSSMDLVRPLIVGVEVLARVQVQAVQETHQGGDPGAAVDDAVEAQEQHQHQQPHVLSSTEKGYEIVLSTQVVRVQDEATIAEGRHTVWLPSYLTM